MSNSVTSRAIIFPEQNRVELAEVVLPALGPLDLLVKIEYSAVSVGTERWVLSGRMEIPGEAPVAFPHVPGYQAAGTILETGADVTGFSPGDRVFSRACRAPDRWKGSWWGGHMQYHVASTERDVVKIPDGVTTLEASYLLLAQVGYNGASKPSIEKKDAGRKHTAVIIGDGLVGQFACQALRHRGTHTLLSGLSPERLALAARFSADEVYDNRGFDFAAHIAKRFPDGVDIVLDTASTMKTVWEGTVMLKKHGQLVLNGYYPPGDSLIDWHWLRRKELSLYCADSRNDERLKATLDLAASGGMNLRNLITHTFSPRRAQDAYSLLLADRQDFLGIVFEWGKEN